MAFPGAAEIADVRICLAMLADNLDVDIEAAVAAKLWAFPPVHCIGK